MLVATLATRALAADGDGTLVDDSLAYVDAATEPPGTPQPDTIGPLANAHQPPPEQLSPEQVPADVAHASNGVTSRGHDRNGEAAEGTDQVVDGEQHGEPGGCSDGCSPALTDRRDPIVAAVPPQEPRPPQQGQPRSQLPSLADVERTLSSVEGVQAQRAERGRTMLLREYQAEYARLAKADADLQQLEAQVAEGALDVDANKVAELRLRRTEAATRLGDGMDDRMTSLEWEVADKLQAAERARDELRARSQGRQTDWVARWGSWPPDPQEWLDQARQGLEQARRAMEAGGDPRGSDRLAELHHWFEELQRREAWRLDNENRMSVVDLNTQPPGYSPVKRGQVADLPGASASDLETHAPGTSAAKQPSPLPGFTATEQTDTLLHAQATATQKPKTRPWTDAEFDAEFQRVINAGRLAGALNLVAVIGFAPGALGGLLLKAQTVRVPGVPPR